MLSFEQLISVISDRLPVVSPAGCSERAVDIERQWLRFLHRGNRLCFCEAYLKKKMQKSVVIKWHQFELNGKRLGLIALCFWV